MKIAILDCVGPDALVEKHGTAGDALATWLQPHLPEAEMTRIDLPAGQKLPEPQDFDGYAITGSEMGVYDETQWMTPLRDFLAAVREAERPVFGICFGHQIMADAWGGRAEKVEQGFVLGARRYDLGGDAAKAHVAHQDQVTRVPPGAQVIASASYCPVGGLVYEFPALSVQFHPEYGEGFIDDLIDIDGEGLMSPGEIAAAKASLRGEVSNDLFGPETAAFFRCHV
jgi:GMP synthase-like glutamine amidotransferase